MILLHGSEKIVERPSLAGGKAFNDYGCGFYCTREEETAREWACKNDTNGFVNRYEWREDNMRVLHLDDPEHTVLEWMAILLQNRIFRVSSAIARQTREYIVDRFSIDTGEYDAIVGYRADDSYFLFAQDFLDNAISLQDLGKALKLGELGVQTVLVSERAFEQLTFLGAEPVDRSEYYHRFAERDNRARRTYREMREKNWSGAFARGQVFAIDILREEMKSDDPRLR